MLLRNLRWVTVWLPLLFIVILEIVEDFVLEPRLGRWNGHLVATAAVGVGAVILSYAVFRTVNRAEHRLRRQNRELVAVNEIGQIVNGSPDLDSILAEALAKVVEVTEMDAGEILLLNESGTELVHNVHHGLFAEAFQLLARLSVGHGMPGTVAASGETQIAADLTVDPLCRREAVLARGIRTMACVPLCAKNRVVGVMNVADRSRSFTTEDISLLEAVGNQIGLAVENTQQRQSLAILEERERIGREMHDGQGQVLGYANTQAAAYAHRTGLTGSPPS